MASVCGNLADFSLGTCALDHKDTEDKKLKFPPARQDGGNPAAQWPYGKPNKHLIPGSEGTLVAHLGRHT